MSRTTDAAEFLGIPDFEDDPQARQEEAPCETTLVSPTKALGIYLLQEFMTPAQRRRIQTARSLSVVVHAPSAGWVSSLRSAMLALASWQQVEVRDGSARTKRKPEEGELEISAAMASGLSVVGISHAPDDLLPRCLLTGADMRITVGQPTDRVVRRAIKAATGSLPRKVPPGTGSLDFSELAACIRVGGRATDAVGRLRRAVHARLALDPTLRDQPHVLDIHGFGPARDWAANLLGDLAEFHAGRLDFGSISRTLTLVSDPGMGKTSWVRALAASAGTPLVVLSLGTVFATAGGGGYLGDIAGRISRTFADAKAIGSPVILYLDEIDSLPSRENLDAKHRDYWLPLITLFLLEVETAVCSPNSRVIVIAATNHGDHVDPALLRPGRIHPTIHIPRPDTEALAGIMRQHLGSDLDGVDLAGFAALAAGATGADVMAWVRDARRTARTAGRRMIPDDLVSLIAPADTRPEEVLWRTALHEAGHAVSVWAQGAFKVTLVSIIAGDQRGGRTETEAAYSDARSRQEIEAIAVAALSGRAAEVTFGLALNSGASDDLRIATQAAASMHTAHGMAGSLVHRGALESVAQVLMMDPALRRQVSQDLDALYTRALSLMGEYRDLVQRVATTLMEVRQLDAAAFAAIVGPRPVVADAEIRHG